MSRIVLKIDLGAKLSLQMNGGRIDAELTLNATHILTNVGRLLQIKVRRWCATLRKVLEIFSLDERSE